jgi:putative Holliday junction resolvase
MRILALDPGSVRVGVAISDELRMIARPVEFIPAEPFMALVDRVKELIRDQQVELIVVGMPRNMDGTYGEAAKQVHERLKVLEVVVTNTLSPRAKPLPNRKHAASTCSAF